MIGSVFTMALVAIFAPLPDDAVSMTASLGPGKLRLGGEYEIAINVSTVDGISTNGAGIPNPILQIKVPNCARLTEKELKSHKDLSKNEYLQAPYEQLVQNGSQTVRFKLKHKPGSDDRFAFNLLSYVSANNGGSMAFVRKRFELPVSSGAQSSEVSASDSTWGHNDVLQLGVEAPDFSLPTADGTMVTLSDYRGKKNVIVTTYRAFW